MAQLLSSQPQSGHMATTTLKVEGMTCGACTSSVESAFADMEGVGHVSVSLIMERAVIQHDPSKVTAETVREAIEDRGFDATLLSSDMPTPLSKTIESDYNTEEDSAGPALVATTLSVGGMTCGACTAAVEGAFKDVAGVSSFSISLLSERAVLEHDPSILPPEKIAETIEDTGFDASVLSTEPVARKTPGSKKIQSQPVSMTTIVAIEGMTCGACTSAVETGFKDVDGLRQFNISLLAERAVISHDPTKLSAEQIVEVIEDRGFDATVVSSVPDHASDTTAATVALKIYGLTQPSASDELEAILRAAPGVISVVLNHKTSRASITFDSAAVGLRAVVEQIEKAGYNALLAEADDNNAQLESLAKTKEIREWRLAFRVSLSFAIPVFLTSMIFPMFIKPLDYGSIKLPIIPGLWLGDVVCFLLTIPVQFGIGRRFYRSAFKSIRHGSPTMDVLVVLGTSSAFFFSLAAMIVSILTPPHSRPATVFDTSTMLITFITLGRLLENGAKSQTSKALSRLMSLAPSMAAIYVDSIAAEKFAESSTMFAQDEKAAKLSEAHNHDLAERVIPTELLQIADIVILRPGDKIPADGLVTYGSSYVDESMVTGEAMPVLKEAGSVLMAGTVNGAGRVDFRVTRAGRDTQLSQIVRLVQEAQTNRAPIQRLADIVAGYFVPVIISLGLFTFTSWMVLAHVLPQPPKVFLGEKSGGTFMICLELCISVIVFACPCALGLSTPTAVMVGTGIGAEKGILFKGGAALETATKITHVVFDKTGTLTTGQMSVSKSDIRPPANDNSESFEYLFWTVVGLAEKSSEHPIAKAIIRAARNALNVGSEGSFDGSVDDFEAVVGKGVVTTVSTMAGGNNRRSHKVVIGNVELLAAHSIGLPTPGIPNTPSYIDSPHPNPAGVTIIHIAINGAFAGSLHLSDTLKTSASATITALNLLRISSSIVTGDSLPTALSIARIVGIPPTNVHASCTPSQKQDLIRELQSQGHTVAMVGDGINDSPGLATADVGISLASGTDVAMEAADVVLMHAGPDDLVDVAASLHLARTIFGRIKLNLLWACGYNVIGLPFAMGFFLPWGIRLPPMAAGAAMASSSVSVVMSSLLLKYWNRPRWMDVAYLEEVGRRPKSRYRQFFEDVAFRVRSLVGRRKAGGPAYVPLENVDHVDDA